MTDLHPDTPASTTVTVKYQTMNYETGKMQIVEIHSTDAAGGHPQVPAKDDMVTLDREYVVMMRLLEPSEYRQDEQMHRGYLWTITLKSYMADVAHAMASVAVRTGAVPHTSKPSGYTDMYQVPNL
jgi:hypothetical protein